MITNFDKILIPLARYMAILRRNQRVFKYVGSLASLGWLAKKQYYMLSGSIEQDLSRVTTAKIGSLKDPHYSVPTLLGRLVKYRDSLTYRVFNLRDSSLAARLNVAIDNLETDVSDGALRKQPFCVMLYGFPGTGKSSFAIQIARVLMMDLYGEFNTSDMVTLNETDEYQSEFRTSHKVVLFDDIGASKYGLGDTKNPWRKVIDFVNNIKKTALNPNVEMKGKVYIQPDLVILTSNLNFEKGAQINGYIPAFEAIFRRLSRIVKVKSHTMVQPLEFTGYGNEENGAYLTRAPLFAPRGGYFTPEDVPREEYIEELRQAFRSHNIDQLSFTKHFNSYFDDCPGDPYSKDEILISQSGRLSDEQLAERDRAEIEYYIKRVNWERFFIEWYEIREDEFTTYFLSPEGIVITNLNSYKNFVISISLFNQAYDRIRSSPCAGGQIKAESKSLKDKLDFNSVPLHSSPQSIKLTQHCKDMRSKWRKLTKLKMDEILPQPYHDHLKLTKGATRPKQKAYYVAYAVYICIDLGISAYELFNSSIFSESLPDKYIARRNKLERKIEKLVRETKAFYPGISDDNASRSIDLAESEESVSDISEVIEVIQDNMSNSLPSSATSCATPWINEADQIKYLLSTVKPCQPCQTVINAQLHNFGEIDLLFIAPKSILVFELKSGLSSFGKAKRQALRYSRVMAALQPDKRIIGLTHTPIGFNMVCDLNASITTEFEGFLRMIGYLDTAIVVEK